MFELGMRLAFDKPTVLVKDDKTDFSFDTGNIEHVGYPRDLRFSKITDFKSRLKEKILGTRDAAKKDPHYSTFLKSIGDFTLPKMNTREVPRDDFILEQLTRISAEVATVSAMQRASFAVLPPWANATFKIKLEMPSPIPQEKLSLLLTSIKGFRVHRVTVSGTDAEIFGNLFGSQSIEDVTRSIAGLVPGMRVTFGTLS